jgi:hypothetical protein
MTCRHLDAPATPVLLRIAPQLGVLAILDEALTTSLCMLVAQHPGLGATSLTDSLSTEAATARRLYEGLIHLSHLLDEYRVAVAQMVADLDEASLPATDTYDIPF